MFGAISGQFPAKISICKTTELHGRGFMLDFGDTSRHFTLGDFVRGYRRFRFFIPVSFPPGSDRDSGRRVLELLNSCIANTCTVASMSAAILGLKSRPGKQTPSFQCASTDSGLAG